MSIPKIKLWLDDLSARYGHQVNYVVASWGPKAKTATVYQVADVCPNKELTLIEIGQIVGNADDYMIIRRGHNMIDVETLDHRQIYPAFTA